MSTPVFWLEPTREVRVRLRRYRSSSPAADCVASAGCCDASVVIHERAAFDTWVELEHDEALGRPTRRARSELVSDDDPRWPSTCDACGVEFGDDDRRQVWADELYSGAPDGQLCTLRDALPGAAFDAWWLPAWYRGPDGIALMVVLPNRHQWHVDGEASNCTRPQREQKDGSTVLTARTHYCWIRHGDPRDPQGVKSGQKLHVDKSGETCAAGAGSILAGSYHGFLHNGVLTS